MQTKRLGIVLKLSIIALFTLMGSSIWFQDSSGQISNHSQDDVSIDEIGLIPLGISLEPEELNATNCSAITNGSCVQTRTGLSLCRLNNVCVVKVDLTTNTLMPKVVIAPGGGTAYVSSMASNAGALAAINGDYFSGCPDTVDPLNCGQGLTFINGVDYTDYRFTNWVNRRSLGFNDNYDPNLGFPSEQGGYHRMLLGGGPQVSFNGEFRWRCGSNTYNTYGNCPCESTVTINDEQFGLSACSWYTARQTFVGFSDDRNTLYFAISEPYYTKSVLEMHDVLWSLGARNTLKMDGGGSSSFYFNDGGYSISWDGDPRLVANAWVIVPYSPPSCTYNSNQIVLYTEANYGGQCVTKDIGEYSNPSAIGLSNDSISSIRVGSSVQAILCKDDNYLGGCETFTGDDSNLSDNSIGDNSVSSAKVQIRSSTTETRLYDSTNYGGTYVSVTSTGLYSVVDTFNDRAESISMPVGWSVRLFEHNDYYGPQVCIQGNDENLWDNYYDNGDVAANSATWFEVYNQTTCPSIGNPAAPTNLTATAVSQTQINLSWADNSTNETGFKIERSLSETTGFTQIATVSANTTTYSNTGLSAATKYYYRVRAYNTIGDSAYSNTASATTNSLTCYTLTVSVSPTSSGSVTLNPTPNCNDTQYISGTVVQLTAIPATNYRFVSWSGDISGTSNPTSVTMDGSRNIIANFVSTVISEWRILLPLTIKYTGSTIAGIHGQVLLNGAPIGGIQLELLSWDGSTSASVLTTTTLSDGTYIFSGVPSLTTGNYYYVRYINSADSSKVYYWATPLLSSYTAGSGFRYDDFDIANVFYTSPVPSATVPLPTTFTWNRRASTPTDSYEFNLLAWYSWEYLFWTGPLGYVGSYTLNSMPAGMYINTPYGWEIWIYSPDGGIGIAYYVRQITFSSTGTNQSALGIPSRDLDRIPSLDILVLRRLEKVE